MQRVKVITAAVGHHIAEGRWLRDSTVTESFLRYLFREDRTTSDSVDGTIRPTSATGEALTHIRQAAAAKKEGSI